MTVTIRSEWPEVARACIRAMELGAYALTIDGTTLTFHFFDDFVYRDVALWLGHALACGLILKGEIER